MKLPDLRDFDLKGKRVLLRVDYDVPLVKQRTDNTEHRVVGDETRVQSSFETINHLLSRQVKVILLSHLGRPDGKVVAGLSLEPVAEYLSSILKLNKAKNGEEWMLGENIVLKENLRFDLGEETNDLEFTKKLANFGDFYINDSFAVSHREHASIVGLPKLLPHAAGLNLLKEVAVLSGVLEQPKRPLVFILGGVKEEKLEVISPLLSKADYILVGGRLPLLTEAGSWRLEAGKVVVGELNQCGKDITLGTVEKFIEIIKRAGTVVWSGPMGQYESDERGGKWDLGTRMIAEAVVESGAFTIVGGGDTEAALTKFGLVDKIDFVSSGGGAMLEFLAYGDLPGLAALREIKK